MKNRELARIYYADLWGLREEKYKYLFGNDVQTTDWQELKPIAPYHFFVPKDFALQKEYEKFWKVTEVFKKWSSGVKTHRDHFVVGFAKEEITQRLRIFTGNLSDELVKRSLRIKETRDWKLGGAREKAKLVNLNDRIYPYAYKPFDYRLICYAICLIDRGCDRWDLMKHLLKENMCLGLMRRPIPPKGFTQVLALDSIADINFYAYQTYFFPLYLYQDGPKGAIHELPLQNTSQSERIPNFTAEFLQAIRKSLGSELTPEEIFHYIYAVLYSPTYRKRYEEFLKIDFPRIPLPIDNDYFKGLSNLGKELVDLHLLKHPALDQSEIGFPKGNSNIVEKVSYDENAKRVYINKDQYFEGIPKEVWEYYIGAYQVMQKYLKDRKKRRLSLDKINHYMRVAKAISLTIQLQEKIDEVYAIFKS